ESLAEQQATPLCCHRRKPNRFLAHPKRTLDGAGLSSKTWRRGFAHALDRHPDGGSDGAPPRASGPPVIPFAACRRGAPPFLPYLSAAANGRCPVRPTKIAR